MERPWSRAAPYFVGLLTGWLVHQLDGRMKLGKVTMSLNNTINFISAYSNLRGCLADSKFIFGLDGSVYFDLPR